MTRAAFLRKLEEIMEAEPGALEGNEQLSSLEAWDSMKVVEFLAFADESFSLTVEAAAIGACRTVEDLARLLKPHVEG